MNHRFIRLGWYVLTAVLFAGTAGATTYYVASGGNDGSAGTSWAAAKQTIQGGVDVATVAGDVVIVSNGTYVLSSQVSISKAITVLGFTGNRADVIVDGNNSVRCFYLTAAATLAHMTITRGANANGAGVYMNGAAGTVTNCLFHCNAANGDPAGGGILMSSSGGSIRNCRFTGNRATGGSSDGGAILMYAGNVASCEFVTNSCNRWGGAIRMDNGSVINSSFVSNFSSASGPGAVQMRINSPVVSNCTFYYNTAVGGGGAIGASAGNVYGCTVVSNTVNSDNAGGGIGAYGATVENCLVAYNRTTSNDGGGIAQGAGTVRNCLVYANYAPRYGGGMRIDGGTLESCTLVANQSGTSFGGIWNRVGTIRNMIIYSNTAPSSANYDNSMAAFTYTCTTPSRTGTGNITGDPKFVAPGSGYGLSHVGGNYRLTQNSPCVNVGTNMGWMSTGVDLDSNARLADTVDMGPYETLLTPGPYATWTYRSKITFSGYTKTGNLTNFPVLIRVGPSAISGFQYSQCLVPGGGDIRFVNSNETLTLKYEIEKWDTTGTSYLWVQVPLIEPTTTFIRMYWGKSGVTAPSSTTNGAVWTNGYRAVWHLGESTATCQDFTTNRNTGTKAGNTARTSGLIGHAQIFDGAGDYIDCGTPDNLDFSLPRTVSAWIRPDTLGIYSAVIAKDSQRSGGSYSYMMCCHNDGTLIAYDAAAWRSSANAGITAGKWYLVTYVTKGDGNILFYVNGKTAGSTGWSHSDTATHNVYIGSWYTGGYDFIGAIDEASISTVTRSSNWVWATWFNQASNEYFCTYGAKEAAPCASIQNMTATNIALTSAYLNGYLASIGLAQTTVKVYYGTKDGGAPTTGLWGANYAWGAGTWGTGSHPSYQATGLTSNRMYFYRYAGINGYGTNWPDTSQSFLAGSVWITSSGSPSEAGPAAGTYTIWRRNDATNGPLTVYYSISGSASNNTDYTLSTVTSVTMAAGVSNATITLTPIQDPFPETTETTTVSLVSGLYVVGTPSSASLTIADAGLTRITNSTTAAGGWFDATKWSLARAPAAGDDVRVLHNMLLTNSTAWIRSCLVSNAMITFSNWNTKLKVGYDVVLAQTSGRTNLTCAGPYGASQMSNRVWVACSNMTVQATGLIDVSRRGYTNACGPGKGYGGSHFGYGGGYWTGSKYSSGDLYDSIPAPSAPGSGGLSPYGPTGGHGGGVVRIEATGNVTVYGAIKANGQAGWERGDIHASAGSGGAVHIQCRRLLGNSSGSLQASGGASGWAGWGGGGGGIAVAYNVAEQAGSNPGVKFETKGSVGGTYADRQWADFGTLYLSDGTFLSTVMANAQFSYVRFHAPGFTNWSPASLLIANYTVIDFATGFSLNVAGNLRIDQYGQLGMRELSTLRVGGDIQIPLRGKLFIRSGSTNGLTRGYGTLVEVTQDIEIGEESYLNLYSDCIGGGGPLIRARDVVVSAGGYLDASARGFGPYKGPGNGQPFGGSGHGGAGGNSCWGQLGGGTYGRTNAPTAAGSGSAGAPGSEGGGLIRIEAGRNITLNGTIRANGSGPHDIHYGGGSGGGIWIKCRAFSGSSSGAILANGGPGSYAGGGGGGGRIAVWYGKPVPSSLMSAVVSNLSRPYVTYTNFCALTNFYGTNQASGNIGGGYVGTFPGATGKVVVIHYDPPIAEITNAVATNVTTSSAWFRGYMIATGLPPRTVKVYWGTEDGGEPTSGLWQCTNTVAGTWGTGSYPSYQASLSANTYYYYRFYVSKQPPA